MTGADDDETSGTAAVKTWHKRVIIIAALVVVGGVAGWLTFNLGLDFLIGGRTFS